MAGLIVLTGLGTRGLPISQGFVGAALVILV